MSSRIECKCGKMINTGSFPNEHVFMLISENNYDHLEDPLDRIKVGSLMLGGDVVIICPQCGRLLVQFKGANNIIFFREEKPELSS